MKRSLFLCLFLLFVMGEVVKPVYAVECTFRNPLIPFGQDPSVVYQAGFYYLVQSSGGMLTIAKSDNITGLGRAEPVPVFTPPPGEDYSYDLWAPELVYLNDQWYIYVAATNAPGNNPSHRMFVLQADTDDPQGTWSMKGKVYDPAADQWAIDGIVFEYHDKLYMVWSGWETEKGDFPQNLYIAEMSDPLTLSSPRHLLSEPDQPWEQSVAAIQEGPQIFLHENQLSIAYSADASWMPAYKLGLLKFTGDNPLDRSAWEKIGPVFEQVTDSATPVYGPGHNSNPIPSPNGQEAWFLYHAKVEATPGWEDRSIRAQKFTWAADGTPEFGAPVPTEIALPIPSGEACGETAAFESVEFPAEGFIDTGRPLLKTMGSFSISLYVTLTEKENPSAFVSQDGGISSNFVLGYQEGKFTFTLFNSLGRNPAIVTSTDSPETDRAYHLVGVYDAASQQIMLYVDGELQHTTAFHEPWEALGSTILGAARRKTERVDIFTGGSLRKVQLFNGALSPEEVQSLSNQ